MRISTKIDLTRKREETAMHGRNSARKQSRTMHRLRCGLIGMALLAMLGAGVRAQEAEQPRGGTVALTLKRAIELALQNSKDIQIAKLQASLADRSAMITRSQFLPNLSAGSGAGYTYGIPEHQADAPPRSSI
jgi:outer membrane protein TolC